MVLLNKQVNDTEPTRSGVKERFDEILGSRTAGWGEGKVLDICASSGSVPLISWCSLPDSILYLGIPQGRYLGSFCLDVRQGTGLEAGLDGIRLDLRRPNDSD